MAREKKTKEFEFSVIERLGIVSQSESGNQFFAFNRISYEGNDAKYDLRRWFYTENGLRMGKGVTFTLDECRKLSEILNEHLNNYDEENSPSNESAQG